jgi:1-acyl-sn-glycerol-3-phosphate acyltransferase
MGVGLPARLAALERRVEAALAGSEGESGEERVRAALDDLLAAYAGVRRELGAELVASAVLRMLYRWWWRVETVGLERVPAEGRALIVANRAPALLPFDALMLGVALVADHPTRRPARPLVDGWVTGLPLVGDAVRSTGALRASPAVTRRYLERDQAVITFPEGPRACVKGAGRSYRLASFGRGVFARIAIETGAPIVPVAIVGSEEAQPIVARLDTVGRWLGFPTLPITATFPWLGLGGLVPLPTKWRLHVGEPVDVAARYPRAAAHDPEAVVRLREQVRERLQALMSEGVRRRRSVYFG